MKIKVILPLGNIPLHSRVTKITGTKVYVVLGEFRLYRADGTPEIMKCDNGCRFLIPMDNAESITIVSMDKEYIWEVDSDMLKKYLYERNR